MVDYFGDYKIVIVVYPFRSGGVCVFVCEIRRTRIVDFNHKAIIKRKCSFFGEGITNDLNLIYFW